MNRQKAVTAAKKEEEAVAHFWKRWHREYIIDLREQHKLSKSRKGPKVSVGDVVLIEQEGAKRNTWKLGRVEATIEGKDGVIRGAEVKTESGRIARPVQKLYPLEINGGADSDEEKNGKSVGNSTDPKTPSDLVNPSLHCPKTSHLPQIYPDGDTNKIGTRQRERSITSAETGTSRMTNDDRRIRRRAAVVGEASRRGAESIERCSTGGRCHGSKKNKR